MNAVIFDIETCINCFIANFIDYETKKKKSFIFYKSKQALADFVSFLLALKKRDYYFVGFNNIGFDNQVLEFIMKNYKEWLKEEYSIETVIDYIYAESQRIIHLPEEERFKYLISENKMQFKVIDVFKQKHYDRPAKATSLKWLQFTMRFKNIEEQPYPHDMYLNDRQVVEVCEYCWNDVESTLEFFNRMKFETDLRLNLSEKFKMNLLNASEPRLARDIFASYLCDEMKISNRDLREKRTFRQVIKLKDVVFPYVQFEGGDLTGILNIIRQQEIYPYDKEENKSTFNLHLEYHGLPIDLGLGGIHGCVKAGVYEPADDEDMEDVDVTSMYPNIAIQNNIKPQQLGDVFNKVYQMLFEERKQYPKTDPMNYVIKIILNSTYGLSKEMNSYLHDAFFTYQITINGQLSLLMLMEKLSKVEGLRFIQCNTDGVTFIRKKKDKELVEAICKEWEEITKLQLEYAHYDKMIIRDVNNYIAVYAPKQITDDEQWEKMKKDNVGDIFDEDSRLYTKMKKKGTFETEMDYHKNPSCLVVSKAITAYYGKGTDYVEFIMNHKDIYDFCGATKRKSNFDLNLYYYEKEYSSDYDSNASYEKMKEKLAESEWVTYYNEDNWIKKEWIEQGKQYDRMGIPTIEAYKNVCFTKNVRKASPQQKVTRFYVSTKGGELKKDFHDGRQTSIAAGKLLTPLYTIENEDASAYDIDYMWYITEARKLIYEIDGK